jgi:monovalent cation:H+ antiporter-2, CPA2 family
VSHEPALIAPIAIGLSLAFVLGMVARRLRLPSLVGYLAAGVIIGPHTTGYVVDPRVATQLAEIGVILIMFGAGLHLSLKDLVAVGPVAIPGATVQILVVTAVGTVLGVALGWGFTGGVLLGLSISVASTVVLVRAINERGELDTITGRVAVGWLILEDALTVVLLVLLPSIAVLVGSTGQPASEHGPLVDLAVALGGAAIFVGAILLAGPRLVPRLLDIVARERSRELFTLAVVTLALGVAYTGHEIFGVSVALGGFLAGAVVRGSDLSHQAAADALPLRDAFTVLYFVSVGLLVDPAWIVAHPFTILAIVAVVIAVKGAAAAAVVLGLGHSTRMALTIAAGRTQIGEFTFILVTLGVTLGLLPIDALQAVIAAALVTITLNPFIFRAVDPLVRRLDAMPSLQRLGDRWARDVRRFDRVHPEARLRNHAIVCGHGRVGRLVTAALERRGFSYVVITDDRHETARLRERGTPTLFGDASNPDLLALAQLATARVLIVAMSDVHATRLIVDRARLLAPRVSIVVRTHSEAQRDDFQEMGGVQPVMGEVEVAVQMSRYALTRFGVSIHEAEAVAQGLRGRQGRPWTPAPVAVNRGAEPDESGEYPQG